MDYERENKGYYLYMLEGVDHKWIKSKNITEASYHGLAPGNYRFKIKYSPDGINWNGPLTEFEIIVPPHMAHNLGLYIILYHYSDNSRNNLATLYAKKEKQCIL